MSAPDGPAPASRLQVVHGGTPSPEELAAVVVALTPAGASGSSDDPTPPAWLRAAIQEGAGGRVASSPADLDAV